MNASNLLSRCLRPLLAATVGVLATSAFAQNPMEEVGQQHNAYIECVKGADPAGERNPVETLVKACGYDTQGEDAAEFIERNSAAVPKDTMQSAEVLLEPYRARITDEQFAYVLKMEEILDSSATVDEARKALEGLEAEAVERLGREPENDGVLAALSTARYSLGYWAAKEGGEASMQRAAGPGPIAKADALGALVGFLTGGIGGAVVVGVAYSVAAAVATYWWWR